MAKKLNTTVHVGDSDTGESRVLGPDDKLSRSDIKDLEDRWGKRAKEFLTDDDDGDEPENISAEDNLAAGHPQADRVPSDPAGPQVEGAMQINEDARTEANPAGVEDSKSGSKKNPNARK